MKTLLIDNYDSYTFNLYQLIAEANGEEPLVVRNDQLTWSELLGLEFDNLVISPGPGTPTNAKDFGVCHDVLLYADVPVLGVCLGHQGLGYVYGTRVVRASEVMHGRLSRIFHDESSLFCGIPQGFLAVRYHSLIVEEPLPDCLKRIAWTAESLIMGLRHRTRPLFGVQFHPESVATEFGRRIIKNFRDLTHRRAQSQGFHGWHRQAQNVSVVPRRLPRSECPSPERFEVAVRRLDRLYDPERAFIHLFDGERWTFWLDSSLAEVGRSRFSFMGAATGPSSQVAKYYVRQKRLELITTEGVRNTTGVSIFDYLAQELHRRRCESYEIPFDFNCGFVGYFGYELKAECGGDVGHPASIPDAMFLLADRLIAFDHAESATYLVSLVTEDNRGTAAAWFDAIERRIAVMPSLQPPNPLKAGSGPVEFRLIRPHGHYLRDIKKCMQYLHAGDTYEVCLTNQITTSEMIDPISLYRTLRRINPAPYSAFLRFDDVTILSSSPERFLRCERGGRVEAKPIKGTSARGITTEDDVALREALRQSEKNRAENLMIVDLLRNDLGLVCEIGSVHVPKLMDVETYATVHQMVSTICGKLRSDLTAIDCIRAAFPGGSMTGAPKRRTMQIIDELEGHARGVYSGAIGFLGFNGTADFNIVIRTIVMTPEGASIGVGGAIVVQSDPEQEFDEILLKARALIHAIVLTVRGDQGTYWLIGDRAPAAALTAV